MSTPSVSARRAKAISLIESGVVHSQSDLVVLLKKSGYRVTQATASRDLEEIGAVRARDKNGESIYKISGSTDEALARISPLPSKLILSIDHSANLTVIHTPPGAAQFLASSLDHAHLTGVIGTIAGDDTIILVTKKATGGAQVAKELRSYSQTNVGKS
ncbi:MAG: arginine repressor [Actinobacteria bacterium]|nr:arginine repressor [Candidatus Planktophila sp.]PHX66848.1 MAG: arginine repressor [Actinomycetota bacterium]